MTDDTIAEIFDLSVLRADPSVTEIKLIRGIPFEFMTRLPAKVFMDIDMDPVANPDWEYDLYKIVVVSPELTAEDFEKMDVRPKSEITVECLEIAGMNVRPTFR